MKNSYADSQNVKRIMDMVVTPGEMELFEAFDIAEKTISAKTDNYTSFSVPTNIKNSTDLSKYLASRDNIDTHSKQYKDAVRKIKRREMKLTIKRMVRGIPESVPLFILPLIVILIAYNILKYFIPFVNEIPLSVIVIVSFILYNVYLEISYRNYRNS